MHSAAGPSSTRPTSRTASCPAAAWTACSRWPASTAPRSSACSSTSGARPATSSGRWRSPTASTRSPSERYGLSASRPHLRRAHLPAVDRRRRPAPRRHAHDRGHPAHQGRDPRRLHRRSACRTCRFGLSPAARHVLNSVFLHECVQAGLDSAIVHAGKIMPLNRSPTSSATSASTSSTTARASADGTPYDPLQQLLEVFADVKSVDDREGGPLGLAGRGAAEAPHHRRRPRRPRSPTSTRRWPAAAPPLDHRQRRAARRHEGRRRAVRLAARCSCRSCCSRPRP